MNASTAGFLLLFAAEIAALHLFFVWIDRRWPPRPRVDTSHLDEKTKKRMAVRGNRFGTLTCLIVWPLLLAAWGFGFYALQIAMVPEIPQTLFVRMPTPAMHLLAGIFASIVLSGPVGLGIMRLVYFRRFHEIMAVGDAHFRFDVRRWMYLTFVWIVPLCVDFESLWLGRYVIFTTDGIHSRGLWSRRSEFHPYSAVRQLVAVDGLRKVNAEMLPDRRFEIEFQDGVWVPSPRFAYHDGRPEDLEPLKYTSMRTRLPIRKVAEFD